MSRLTERKREKEEKKRLQEEAQAARRRAAAMQQGGKGGAPPGFGGIPPHQIKQAQAKCKELATGALEELNKPNGSEERALHMLANSVNVWAMCNLPPEAWTGELVGKLKMAGHHTTAAKFKDLVESALKANAEAQLGMRRR